MAGWVSWSFGALALAGCASLPGLLASNGARTSATPPASPVQTAPPSEGTGPSPSAPPPSIVVLTSVSVPMTEGNTPSGPETTTGPLNVGDLSRSAGAPALEFYLLPYDISGPGSYVAPISNASADVGLALGSGSFSSAVQAPSSGYGDGIPGDNAAFDPIAASGSVIPGAPTWYYFRVLEDGAATYGKFQLIRIDVDQTNLDYIYNPATGSTSLQ